jgi:type I restriction enzyme S subunit
MTEINVPKVRFEEFQKPWVTMSLSSQVSSVDSGWSPQCDEGVASDNEWGVLKTTSIQWTGFESCQNKKLPKELLPREMLSLRKDDILVTRAGPTERVGVISIVDRNYSKLMLSDKIIRLRVNADTNPSYLALSLSLKKSNYQIMRKASGLATSQTNISQKFLLQTTLNIPPLPEQQKIASFLSKVEKKIYLLSNKKNKLTEYKKGVMQQLFNGKFEQKTQDLLCGQQSEKPTFFPPTLRFKADNCSEFPDWEEIVIGSFGRVVTGSTPKTSEPENYGGDKLFISPGDLDGRKFILDTKTKLTQKGFESGRAIPAGSVCFVCIGSTIGKVALNALEAITNQQINSIIVDHSKYDHKFVFAILEKESKKIKRIAGEQAIPIINKTEFSKYKLAVPTKIEQVKIANFLSAIDQKIDLANSELEKAKEWKKGLLQQMFV